MNNDTPVIRTYDLTKRFKNITAVDEVNFLGSFMVDFYYGGLSMADTDTYRYTVTYHALSLLKRWFESDPHLSLSGALTELGLAEPGRALALLLLYGCGFTLAAILIFRRQDLMAKS